MSVSRIASRYAKSLIELSMQYDKLDLVMEDMKGIKRLTTNRDFYVMLKSPVVPDHIKSRIVKLLLEGKIDDLTLRFFLLLIQKQREMYMPEIVDAFDEQYREIRNIHTIKVTSAHKLSEATLQVIRERLRKIERLKTGQIEIVERVSPDIIGGFILEFKDFVYNASIVQRLADLKKKNFEENPYKSKVIAR